MRDIAYKQSTLRTAIAEGSIHCSPETVKAVEENTLPKGSPFDFAKAAGYMGAKQTASLIPHCHPVSIDGMEITFEPLQLRPGWKVTATGKSVGRTGIEMETLMAVNVTLLTLYDLFKNIDKQLEVTGIKLLDKKGGKTDRERWKTSGLTCAVIRCSTPVAEGGSQDDALAAAVNMLEENGARVVSPIYIKEDREALREAVNQQVSSGTRIIFTCGGTGLGKADFVPEVLASMAERSADGIVHAMRDYGLQRNPLAMMSQLTAGSIGTTLLVSLPGSTEGVKECLHAILPQVFHAAKMLLKKQAKDSVS